MSNNVGELYKAIIENVIRETKNEFEESGDDPAVLDMLRQAWRKRLAGMNVTKHAMWQDGPRMPLPGGVSTEMPSNLLANLSGAPSGTVSGSLGADLSLGQTGIPRGSDTLNFTGIPQVKDTQSNAVSTTFASEQVNPADSGKNGSGHPLYAKEEPFRAISSASSALSDTNSSGSQTSAALNPLDSSKHTTNPPSSHGGQIQLSPKLQNQIHTAMNNPMPRVPQIDGPLDEELNSDLDDSEDELNSNDEDEDSEQTQIMLCLYEKVHKVKTRWKYTLRDGVANVNGLDYVFTRATGESEW